MTPKYRFLLQLNDGARIPVNPVYKDDLSINYEMESNERFFRAKLNGKLTFVRKDYDMIKNAPFDAIFYLYVQKSDDWGATYKDYHKAKFVKTDCTFTDYDRKVTVEPQIIDEYNDVLAGIENEYNLISLAPEIESLTIYKRPLIQMYVPGDSIVSCFLGGTHWEQDVTAEEDDQDVLVNKYKFALNTILKEIKIKANGVPPACAGVYAGRMAQQNAETWKGLLYSETGDYYIEIEQTKSTTWGLWVVKVILYRTVDNVSLFFYRPVGSIAFDNVQFDMNAVPDSEAGGTMKADMSSYSVYSRYLCDVTSIDGRATFSISQDDIVANNRNYKYVIGYGVEVAYISNNYSDEPTEWGLADNGKYFEPPVTLSRMKFYPIAQSTWRNASLWFAFHLSDWILEEKARKEYILRDTYLLSSCIEVLLKQIAPGITHKPTAEYSQFLYGSSNPISGQIFKLLVSVKSNIIVGEYQNPTMKATATLRQFMDMLRDVFQCYWYIEDGKFKIEHILFFKSGGGYFVPAGISHDLTKEKNICNGKAWDYNTSEYSYDKISLAERYQFGWMDDVTEAFEGEPIEVNSTFVEPGKIEEINVSNFTSDIDMMLLNPENISPDGFALFAAVESGGKLTLPFIRQTVNGVEYFLQNGYVAFINLLPNYYVYDLPAKQVVINGEVTIAKGVKRAKKQTLKFPAMDDPNPMELIKTSLGLGEVEKLSVNLQSRSIEVTLKYDIE